MRIPRREGWKTEEKDLPEAGKPKRKNKKRLVSEADIVKEFVSIAFSEESKPADKLRALDWLGDHLDKKRKNEETLEKLREVLDKIESGF